ncbi:hypothetical protein ABHN11_24585 [Brevibacillus centrosporus]|uniref:hypothetical protein n=1 Tax=Brevibacillus centrosporus TaxID=54910 RepID=UPI003D21673E
MTQGYFRKPEVKSVNSNIELHFDVLKDGNWIRAKNSYSMEYALDLYKELHRYFGGIDASRDGIVEERVVDGNRYVLIQSMCNKQQCKKCRDLRVGHGPYWYHIAADGKKKYIGKTLDVSKLL